MAEAENKAVPPPKCLQRLQPEQARGVLYLLVEKTNNCLDELYTDELKQQVKKKYKLGAKECDEVFAFLKVQAKKEDRPMSQVEAPPKNPLPSSLLWIDEELDLDMLQAHLLKEGRLEINDALKICFKAGEIMKKEPNLLRLNDPVTIAGDIHGQYFDLMRLFHVGGDPKNTQYLFLGDYVDRGTFSSEVIFLLFSFKIMFPQKIWMLRGNHECRHLTEYFNFKEECLYKYNEAVYNAAMDAFDCLPISAVVNGKFLCVHGGLSPDIRVLDDIDKLSRFQEVPREGPFCDLLWADPADNDDNAFDKNDAYKGWFFSNEARHCSYKFGAKACQFFLQKNNLTAVIRGHEVKPEGYEMHFKGRGDIPQVFTIFSAPNYCDAYKNKGSCLKIENNSLNIRQFVWTSHPYYLPNFMDVFSWSLPFVAEKVTSMLSIILSKVSEKGGLTQAEKKVTLQTQDKSRVGLRQKVLAVSRVMKFYRTLQQEQADIIKLKQLSPNRKLPNGVLAGGKEAIQAALKSFNDAKRIDAESEMYPNSPAVTRSSTMFSLVPNEEQKKFLESLGGMDEEDLALVETPSISVEDSMADDRFEREESAQLKTLVGASRKIVKRGDKK